MACFFYSTDPGDDARESPGHSSRESGHASKKPRKHRGRRGKHRHRKTGSVDERSAGVLCYRDRDDGSRVYLLLDYGRHWGYPKGHLEAGETDEAAARRELREETGIDAVEIAPGFTFEIKYEFQSSTKGHVRKTVAFFVGRVDTSDVILSEEHLGYAWATREQAMERLTFDNARNVMLAALEHLDSLDE